MKIRSGSLGNAVVHRCTRLAVLTLLLAPGARAELLQEVAFGPEAWDLESAETVQYLGREALAGKAWLKDVELEDGIIEVDLAVSGQRSYPGILFRAQSAAESERVYLRPHRAGLYPDALQYAPIFHGVTCWQLYHGPGNTAPTALPEGAWFTVRLEIKGSQARVFIQQEGRPDLAVQHLQHGVSRGRIGLLGPRNGTAYFSRFRYRKTDELDFAEPPDIVTPPETLATWQISPAMAADQVPQTSYPRFYGIFATPWRTVEAEPGGMVNLSKVAPSTPAQPRTVWARTTVRSDGKEDVRLSIGYSDDISVFLNRRPMFTGRSGYRSRDPSFVGALGLSDTVVLRLEPGLNEIFFTVTDSFGGWGFMARADRPLEAPRREEGRLGKAWQTDEVFSAPESVLYDPQRRLLYVSNFDKIDTRRVDTGTISKVGLDGEVLDLEWVTGLDGPCGMAILGGNLYVVESFKGNLVEIDIETGRIRARHPAPAGHVFLNDIAADSKGDLFISDTSRGWREADIYRFSEGEMENWRGGYDLHRANRILIHQEKLVVGSVGEGLLKRIDLGTGRMEVLAALGAGIIDGIRATGDGSYLVSHWEGKVFRVTAAGEVIELLDLQDEGLNTADFELIEEEKLLVIPTFTGNRLVAFHLEG